MEELLKRLAIVLAVANLGGQPNEPLAGKTVVLDPGHNGLNAADPEEINRLVPAGGFWKACNTTGTASNDGSLEESELNWSVSRELRKVLQERGAHVVMTRSNNSGVGPCINQRAAVGNRVNADAAVSIHADGNESTSASGFHVIRPGVVDGYTEPIVAPSKRLALDLRDALDSNEIGRSTYIGDGTGVDVRRDLGGLNLSEVPIAMIEMGNMRNPRDLSLMKSRSWRRDTATEIADGVERYLGR